MESQVSLFSPLFCFQDLFQTFLLSMNLGHAPPGSPGNFTSYCTEKNSSFLPRTTSTSAVRPAHLPTWGPLSPQGLWQGGASESGQALHLHWTLAALGVFGVNCHPLHVLRPQPLPFRGLPPAALPGVSRIPLNSEPPSHSQPSSLIRPLTLWSACLLRALFSPVLSHPGLANTPSAHGP